MTKPRTKGVRVDPRKINSSLRATLRKRVLATYDTCAPEVDEIIPVARGGSPYDWDNLQLVHRICNQRKGSKMAGDIGLRGVENPTPVSREW